MEVYLLSNSGNDGNALIIEGITPDMTKDRGPLGFMNPDDAPNPSPAARAEAAKKWPGLRVFAERAPGIFSKAYLQDAIGPNFDFPGCGLAVSDRAREILEPVLGDQVIFLELEVVNAPCRYWGFYATQYYGDVDLSLCVLEPPYDSAPDRRQMMRQIGFRQTERLDQLYVFRVPATDLYTPFYSTTFATQKFVDLVMKHQLGGFGFRRNFYKGFRLPPGEEPGFVSPGPRYELVSKKWFGLPTWIRKMSSTKPHAVKRWRHPGDPGAYGDWIVAEIELASPTEAGYTAACKALVDATADVNFFLDLGDGTAAWHYKLAFSSGGERMHERDFFAAACKYPGLRPYAAQYVRNVNRDRDEYWQDEYHAAGSYAIAELVLADESCAPLLGQMLFIWDMGHETYQRDLIDMVFERYGLTENTLALLAARCFADGQSIDENIWRALHVHGFRETLSLERFAEAAIRLPSNTFDLSFQAFATLWGGSSGDGYQRAIRIFSTALYALENGRPIDWTRMANRIHADLDPDFEPHRLMEEGGDCWEERSEDWNAGLDNAQVESTNWALAACL